MKQQSKEVFLPSYTCLRCGHKWHPRTDKKPNACPNIKCHSPYWNVPRRTKKNTD